MNIYKKKTMEKILLEEIKSRSFMLYKNRTPEEISQLIKTEAPKYRITCMPKQNHSGHRGARPLSGRDIV